ncbi:hypothetical protein NP493_538g04049 [Ridgeia piscesae]|uniref:Inositol hexakisphosphate and diphosphoinositol-pentakisphosphate kinase n=1 Tax=Ridgeia piscesae TaxID=27915 RepID=A0AAD9NS52_RIDPI|nr:hypothetical protein NP493_538g04049 [Ridgeia piscesae]
MEDSVTTEKSESNEDVSVYSKTSDVGHVVIGVCAMEKKSNARPMQEIMDRLRLFESLQVVVFDEATILQKPVEEWPVCDCLISFHSKGFPLDKAVERAVYQILEEQGIDLPRYAVLDRDSNHSRGTAKLVENEDTIEVNNHVFHKPLVEKPISAEDHNVYIYFPASAGGGCQRLFRKACFSAYSTMFCLTSSLLETNTIGSRSSVYSPVSSVRKVGSYIYEEFMPTDGTDVKVYMVGPEYANVTCVTGVSGRARVYTVGPEYANVTCVTGVHGRARVYTVGPEYAHAEARKSPALDGKVERDKSGKEIRYPVILTAAEKLIARNICLAFKVIGCRDMILRQIAPHLHIPYSINYQTEDLPIVPTMYGTMMELRCVIAVIRHGDRTPKQKMKMEVRHKRYGRFSGINRKVQLKYQPHGAPRRSSG